MLCSAAVSADDWVTRLRLGRHPEGGWYREIYRSPEQIGAMALPQVIVPAGAWYGARVVDGAPTR
jgi:predicted cupin superfamily sugar epimerase